MGNSKLYLIFVKGHPRALLMEFVEDWHKPRFASYFAVGKHEIISENFWVLEQVRKTRSCLEVCASLVIFDLVEEWTIPYKFWLKYHTIMKTISQKWTTLVTLVFEIDYSFFFNYRLNSEIFQQQIYFHQFLKKFRF